MTDRRAQRGGEGVAFYIFVAREAKKKLKCSTWNI
jgi:hypothetical protein